jgi:diadenosine tetraphosphatase ApaH/serine/threonine PP2A family protein phosphatase
LVRGRPRYTWTDKIKIGLLEIGFSVVDWTGLAQDKYRWRAIVNAVMNLRVPPRGYTTGELSSGASFLPSFQNLTD